MNLTGPISVNAAQLFSSSATQAHQLGTLGLTRDGRRFRYCKAGASALVVGNVIQAPAQITNHQNLVAVVTTYGATVGDKYLVATLGGTAATANQYAEGWAIIDTTPGLGYAYPISGHAAQTSTTGNVTLRLADDAPVQVVLSGSSRISLQQNPYNGVIQAPVTTLTGSVVGVAVYPITASEYGWIQVGGPGAVLISGTPGVGFLIGATGAAAGAGAIWSSTHPVIGTIMVTGQNGKVQAVYLRIS